MHEPDGALPPAAAAVLIPRRGEGPPNIANRVGPTPPYTYARGGQLSTEHECHALLIWADGIVETHLARIVAWTPDAVQVWFYARAGAWWVWLDRRDVSPCDCERRGPSFDL